MKVLDPTLDQDAIDPLVDLKTRLDSFLHERNIAFKTRDRKLRSVVRALGEGTLDQHATGVGNPATYLLFELATGDLREQIDLSRRFDLAYRLRVLHNTAKGLSQLHTAQIAHQDLKPSNVVTFDRTSRGELDTTKIADLGHAHDRRIPRPDADRVIAGDPSYALPEQLYDQCPDDWDARRCAADLYQLDSLSVFLMTGVGATQLIGGHLRPEHHWDVWLGGSYADILPHLIEATDAVLEEVFGYYRDFGNLPNFLGDVMAVQQINPTTSRWTIQGPFGIRAHWIVKVTEQRTNELIRYETVSSPRLKTYWEIHFTPVPDTGETEVREVMKAPLGRVGRAALALIGKFPDKEVCANLQRLRDAVGDRRGD